MQADRPWLRSWPSYLAEEVSVPEGPADLILSASAERGGKRTCLRYQGATMTYEEVDSLSGKFAGALASLGVAKGDRVAIFSPNTPQFVISYFGILKAGGVVVACSPLYKERELESQLKDSGASVVVAANDVVKGNDLFSSLEGCRYRLSLKHVISASVTDYLPLAKRSLAGLAGVKNVKRRETLAFVDLVRKELRPPKRVALDPEHDVALLQYTGGTTGVSKGAMLTHRNLLAAAAMGAMALPLTEKDVSLAVLPLFHIFGMAACMNAPILSGGEVVLLPRFDVAEVMRTIERDKVTCFCGVPTMYVAINNHPKAAQFRLGSLRVAVSGGAPLPVAVSRKFIELTGGNLVEGYGLTETTALVAVNPPKEGKKKEGSIGIPFPSTDVRIASLDDPRAPLGQGETGELEVRGPQVMRGYWNDPRGSSVSLVDGWLLTGDVAKMDEDGYLYIVDRKKDMVDVGGAKVYPREVEEVLYQHPAVKEAAVVGVPDPYMGETVKAFVVLKDPSASVKEDDLNAFCAERLSKFKVPRYYEFVPDLPKTLVGKVMRRKLKESSPRP